MTDPTPDDPTPDFPSLSSVIATFLRGSRMDCKPDRAEYLARFPELATELEAFFQEYDRFDRLASPLRDLGRQIQVLDKADLSEPSHPTRLQAYPIVAPLDFGDFELIRLLGSGGMGVVYEARQRTMNRPVALKMIHGGEWASAADVLRFRNEVESIARLAHPHIVPIFEVGETQGHHYYSMPLMGGGSLASRLDRLKGDPKAVARLMIDIVQAVDYAHQRGIIHRDLKPSNVLLDDAGRPHVSDFGLARRIGEDSSLTATDAILGSPPYMAPEQAAGRSREVTTATDVYGLGAILYTLLLGRPPFQGSSPIDVLEKVRQRDPDRPRSIDRKIDADLETICLKCLEKEPGRRYVGAMALADDLTRWLEGRTILARRAGPARRLAKWSRRHPVAALLGLGIALGTPAAFGIIYAAYQSSERNRAVLDSSLYQTRIALAERELSGGNADRAEELLEECPPTLRGWEWNYLKRRRLGDPIFLVTPGQPPWTVAFSPDGLRLATGHFNGIVRILDAKTSREVHRLETQLASVSRLAFSPDGRRLACASISKLVRVWDAETGRENWSYRPGVGCWSLAYRPDGGRIAVAAFDGTVRLLDTETGREIRSLVGHSDRVTGVSYRPDGLRLASSSDDGSIRVWDPETATLVRTIVDASRFPIRNLAFSPDGRLLAAVTDSGAVVAWNPESGSEVLRLDRHFREAYDLTFSPDGSLLATSGSDATVKVWGVEDGREVITLRGHDQGVRGVAFSPDGLKLASAGLDDSVRVWDARPWDESSKGQARIFAKTAGRVEDIAFSPDGRIVASADQDGAVTIWDVSLGRSIRTLRGPRGGLTTLAFSPDGRRVATSGYGKAIHILSLDGLEERRLLEGHERFVLCVAYHPGGRLVASGGSDRRLKLWDLEARREVASHPIARGWVQDVAFSPDGRTLAAGCGGGTLVVCDGETGGVVKLIQTGLSRINALGFSPDGQRLALGGASSQIDILRASDWTLDRRIVAEDLEIRDVAFSPDGLRFASIGMNHRADLWNLSDGRLVASLRDCVAGPNHLAFSRDGRYLAATGGDRSVRVWDLRESMITRGQPGGSAE